MRFTLHNVIGDMVLLLSIYNSNTDKFIFETNSSAYVEFLHNESVELALSLDGTSFMSRILKVFFNLFFCCFKIDRCLN